MKGPCLQRLSRFVVVLLDMLSEEGDVDYLQVVVAVVVDVVSAFDAELVAVAVAAVVLARLVVLAQQQLEQREQHAQLAAEPFLLHLLVAVELMGKVPS